MTASHFVDDVLEHGAEGCNYLLAVDVDMETVDGYEMSSWERGYGDFEMVPDLDTLRPIPWHPATVLVMADLQWHGGSDGGGQPAPDPAPAAGPAGRAGLDGHGRHRAGVHAVQGHLRAGVAVRLPRPAPGQPLQRGLLAAGHRAGRAADPPHPQRDGGRGDEGRELEGRVQLRPARDQLPLRRGAARVRRPRDLQERRQGDRRPGGDGHHVHGQVQRAGGQLVPHPLLAGHGGRHERLRRGPHAVRALRGRPAGVRCAS